MVHHAKFSPASGDDVKNECSKLVYTLPT